MDKVISQLFLIFIQMISQHLPWTFKDQTNISPKMPSNASREPLKNEYIAGGLSGHISEALISPIINTQLVHQAEGNTG